MSDELETTKEVAKAVQELGKAAQRIAETTGIAIEEVSRLLQYIGHVIGTVPEDAIGLLGADFLRQWRIRNLGRMLQKTFGILQERGIKQAEPISPRLAIPTFEAASDESNETLQDLWARLLANAMDPNHYASLKGMLIDTLKAFEPIDALLLDRLASMTEDNAKNIGMLASELELRPTELQLSADHLTRLDCVFLLNPRSKAETKIGPSVYHLTALGHELWLAVQDDAED